MSPRESTLLFVNARGGQHHVVLWVPLLKGEGVSKYGSGGTDEGITQGET